MRNRAKPLLVATNGSMLLEVHGACLQSNSFLIGIPVFEPHSLSPLPPDGGHRPGGAQPFNACPGGLEALELLILFQVRGLEPIFKQSDPSGSSYFV